MKSKFKVKADKIGTTVSTKTLGSITIAERHADILAREGRFDLIDGLIPAKKLVALGDKTIKQLQNIAKDLPGYHLKLKKEELIKLINAAPTT